jgi:hypothetical protein
MIHSQNLKVVHPTALPATVGSTATSTLVVDRIGFDQVSVLVSKAASSGTAFASVLKIEESDDNSDYSNVTALVKDGTGGFTMSAVSTSNASVVKMDIDCLAKKRYLRLSITPDVSAVVSVVALLSRGEEYPSSQSGVNVTKLVKG